MGESQIGTKVLTFQGKMQEEEEKEDKKEKWYCKQCSSGSFFRQITLPDYIEEEKANCKFKNGKLTITIPKKMTEGNEKPGKELVVEVE